MPVSPHLKGRPTLRCLKTNDLSGVEEHVPAQRWRGEQQRSDTRPAEGRDPLQKDHRGTLEQKRKNRGSLGRASTSDRGDDRSAGDPGTSRILHQPTDAADMQGHRAGEIRKDS